MIIAAVSGARVIDPAYYCAKGKSVPAYVERSGPQGQRIISTFVRRAYERALQLGESFLFAAGECEYSADAWGFETCCAIGADHRLYTIGGAILGRERGEPVEKMWGPAGNVNPLRRNDALAQFLAGSAKGGDIVVFGALSASWAHTKGTAYTAREVIQRAQRSPRLRAWVWEFDEDSAGASSRRIDGRARG